MLAIIPAGGRAERFGGIFKELLPIGEREYLLSSAIERSAKLGADRFLVVSNADKAAAHANFVQTRLAGYNVTLTVRRACDTELWAGLRPTLPLCAESNLLVFPDTVFETSDSIPACDFALGLFETAEPWRFGVLADGQIRDKDASLRGSHRAYGCVYWSAAVARDWWIRDRARAYESHTEAFNEAMRVFGYRTFVISSYYDLGNWASYQAFVRGQ
jgi:hypothetical protein